MCIVSNVGDEYKDRWNLPKIPSDWNKPADPLAPTVAQILNGNIVTKAEFDALRKEVEIMKQRLIEAAEQDMRDGNPNCEMEDKVAFLKAISKAVGVNIEQIFGKKDSSSNNE